MPLQPRSSRYFFAVANLLAHGALYGALRHSLRAPPHRSVPPLNLHRARVRRNRGRLPSSRCIESAQTHRARACALPARASDTTLGLLVTYFWLRPEKVRHSEALGQDVFADEFIGSNRASATKTVPSQ